MQERTEVASLVNLLRMVEGAQRKEVRGMTTMAHTYGSSQVTFTESLAPQNNTFLKEFSVCHRATLRT